MFSQYPEFILLKEMHTDVGRTPLGATVFWELFNVTGSVNERWTMPTWSRWILGKSLSLLKSNKNILYMWRLYLCQIEI